MSIPISDYESKLIWFLVLLVVFLAVVNYQSVELAKRTRRVLELEFERRARDTAAYVEDKLQEHDLEAFQSFLDRYPGPVGCYAAPVQVWWRLYSACAIRCV